MMYKSNHPNLEQYDLFHGTKNDAINSIAENGFDIKYNKRSAFGKGSYFSSQAGYSKDYMNKKNEVSNEITYMFLCDVLASKSENKQNG